VAWATPIWSVGRELASESSQGRECGALGTPVVADRPGLVCDLWAWVAKTGERCQVTKGRTQSASPCLSGLRVCRLFPGKIKETQMISIRDFASSIFGAEISAPLIDSQYLSRYREFQFGAGFRWIEVTTDFDLHLHHPSGYRVRDAVQSRK
jgi:hypothetical protein